MTVITIVSLGTPLDISGIKYAVLDSNLTLVSTDIQTIENRVTVTVKVSQTLTQTTKDKINALFSNVYIKYS